MMHFFSFLSSVKCKPKQKDTQSIFHTLLKKDSGNFFLFFLILNNIIPIAKFNYLEILLITKRENEKMKKLRQSE